MATEYEVVVQCADILGEVPLWCSRSKKLWWTDVRRPAIQSYDPASGKHTAVRLAADMLAGSIALREAGGLLMATNRGLFTYDPEKTEAPKFLVHPETHLPQNRLNDGKVDRKGRFWVGSMKDGVREPEGNFYRFDPDHTCHHQFGGVNVPNSVSWSPDSRTMYFADTHLQLIWAFDFDLDDGVMSNRRVFKDWSGSQAKPDGSTVDADGCLWNAMVGTGQVVRLTPAGKVDRVVQLPITNATCPAFGGDKLDTLYITSHSQRLTPEQIAREPYAGALFAVHPGVKGLPEPRFAG